MDQRGQGATFLKERNCLKLALKNITELKLPSALNWTRKRSQRADVTLLAFTYNYMFLLLCRLLFSAERKATRSDGGGDAIKVDETAAETARWVAVATVPFRATAPLLQGGMTQLPAPALIPQIDQG
jgi:hypothetical protein